MSPRSALYVGSVSHRRTMPRLYQLRHRVYWLLVDLAELPALGARLRLFSHNRTNLVSFHDTDHGDGSGRSLFDQAVAHLRSAGIDDPGLNVQLLCMPRVAGYDFNPLSIYFCRDGQGSLIAMIYEVNNTLGGRKSYVIPAAPADGPGATDGSLRQACDKSFYVSPFLDLDMAYRFRVDPPGERVTVAVQARKDDCAVINTCLIGRRRAFTDGNLAKLSASHPMVPLKVTGAIYWHALKLWWRGFAISGETADTDTSVTIVRPNS